MERTKVEMYLTTNAKYFEGDKMLIIREKLTQISDDRFIILSALELKDPTMMLLISIFLGSLGIDRFMLGDTTMGILKLLTGGCCGVLTIIDWFSITKKTKDANFNKLMTALL